MKKRGELQRQILYCLKEFPDTRNSDIELTIAVWKQFYPQRIIVGKTGTEVVRLRDLFDLPREDYVKRIRAKVQNEQGLYLPTSLEVAKQRDINEYEWRNYMARFPILDAKLKEKSAKCDHGIPLFVSCPDCKK